MTRLDIRLLGEFAVSNGGTPITSINSQRLQCLLAYLLLHRDTPIARQRLAFLFWPDSSEAQARSNLRNLLHALSQTLPDAEQFVESDGQTVQWRREAPYTLDVDALLSALETARTAADLERVLDLRCGPLLPSCYDDWIVPERERLEQKVADALQRFIDLWEREGAYRDAIRFAHHLAQRDPLREDLYRQIMRLYALNGDRAGVARTYKECRDALKRELDVEPSRQTVEAFERCKQMDPPVPGITAAPAPNAPAVAVPLAAREAKHPAAPATAIAGPPAPAPLVTDAQIRRRLLVDALQHPATEIPLTLAAISGLFLLLYVPALPGISPVVLVAAWVLLGLSVIAAGGSFFRSYVLKFDEAYERKARALQEQQQGAARQDQRVALEKLHAELNEGFKTAKVATGHYALRDLDFEYQQLQAALARHNGSDPLALSYLPVLVDETYRQGLSVLEDALELARATSSPKDQRLGAEIEDLEKKIRASGPRAEETGRVRLWQESLEALRHRQEWLGKEQLRLDELLQHAERCEAALNQTRVELAALRADNWTVSVNGVLETLQRTIDQAKAVQEEMRRLGY